MMWYIAAGIVVAAAVAWALCRADAAADQCAAMHAELDRVDALLPPPSMECVAGDDCGNACRADCMTCDRYEVA